MDLDCLPYGAGHAQEGVCLLVRMGPHRILLDCGVEDIAPLSATLNRSLPADFVVCSHAHSDHARGLLALHQSFPHLPIYASEVTARLLPLNWPDRSQQPESSFCQALPWQSPIELRPGLSVQLFPSGDLPGAATVLLTYARPPPHLHPGVHRRLFPVQFSFGGRFALGRTQGHEAGCVNFGRQLRHGAPPSPPTTGKSVSRSHPPRHRRRVLGTAARAGPSVWVKNC